ncbi:MAG: dienelactone hydrolase family protein [Gammaproteobacteria bacterium]|nr:dienelactone hydrolase family protein [Gammaproteobacteria bacterium]
MNTQNNNVQYECGSTQHQGYLALAKTDQQPTPGIIVIHEWWGINDYIRQRCDMLAELGYTALGVDLYGNGYQAESPEQATEAMNSVLSDIDLAGARLRAGHDFLLSQPNVDASKSAAIGYCFGGAMALHMARLGLPLSATVSFHGILSPFHAPGPGSVQARILVCHGEDDAMVSMDDVESFRKEMDRLGANYEVIVHQGAGHGFTSPKADHNAEKYGIPVGYNEQADQDSWQAMKDLFSSLWDR